MKTTSLQLSRLIPIGSLSRSRLVAPNLPAEYVGLSRTLMFSRRLVRRPFDQAVIHRELHKKTSSYKHLQWQGDNWYCIAERIDIQCHSPKDCLERWMTMKPRATYPFATAPNTSWTGKEAATLWDLRRASLDWYDIALQIPGRDAVDCHAYWLNNYWPLFYEAFPNRRDLGQCLTWLAIREESRGSEKVRQDLDSSTHDASSSESDAQSEDAGTSGTSSQPPPPSGAPLQRKRDYWTAFQLQLLNRYKSQDLGWKAISKKFPGHSGQGYHKRTAEDCKETWQQAHTIWSKDEIQALKTLRRSNKWSNLATGKGLPGRSHAACRLKWDMMDNSERGERLWNQWTGTEDKLFIDLVETRKLEDWEAIAKMFTNCSADNCSKRYERLCSSGLTASSQENDEDEDDEREMDGCEEGEKDEDGEVAMA